MRPRGGPERERVRGQGESADAPAGAKLSLLDAMIDLWRLIMRSEAPWLKTRTAVAFVLIVVGKALGIWAPFLLGHAVNKLAKGQSAAMTVGLSFAALAIGWSVVRFLAAAAPQARDAIFTPVSQAAQRRAAAESFAHALSLSLDYHQTKRTGALGRTIDRGARSIEYLLRTLVFNLAPTVLELLMAAVALAKAYDWRFAAVAIATVVLYGAGTFMISDWRIHHRRALNAADSEAAGRSVDALLNYETVKSFGAEARAAEHYDEALGDYARAAVKANTSLVLLNVIQSAVMSAGLAAMAVLAGMSAAQGKIGPGDVMSTVLIMIQIYSPLAILGFAYREIRQSIIDMEAMVDLRRQVPAVADAANARELPEALVHGADLAFTDVSFRHTARSQGLDGVSFRAPPGSTTAIVGPSGAGKTTLVRLALRLIDPQGGAVSIDGSDLRAVRQSALRRAVALVPQDVALFNDTLRTNIGFGRPDANDQEVWAAADAAELGDFIRGLPEGMETKVGERGLKLSGGERQRVGLARALIAQPRLLILDEATSALDSRTEAAIQATLRRLRGGRT
ncbi:MAG: Fe-S cluster assembly ABC-type transport system, permease and ATPase component, partial [Caulobacteraceae bacterium]|nr:Fe-S cluster assembly ABC-type transport system, permease and ATPase component [Caulobacteraceae bacterium]